MPSTRPTRVLIIGYVWPEPRSSAAGGHMMQIIESFLQRGWHITFSSPAGIGEHKADLASLGIDEVGIELNNSSFDTFISQLITLAGGENIAKDAVLFNAVAVDGLKQKHVANSALYNRTKVEDGITLVSLLRTAAEIDPSKLVMPFSENDKANMKGWFEFNE